MNKEMLREKAMAMKPWLVQIRRDFHRHPELSLEEKRTSKEIRRHLDEMGIPYETYEGQTAVVALIKGAQEGKTVALRGDMDGLPIQEKNKTEYCSIIDGVMHACGHDAHITILLGAAKLLSGMTDKIKGNIKLLFQPAEETVGGAERMVKSGCMENPKVDYVTGLHVMPYLPCGIIESRHGALNGASDNIYIHIKGKAAHGAYPEMGTDAIFLAGHVITALQGVASRSVSPLDSVVLTLGTIEGGVKENVLAEEVKIRGTLRTLHPVTRTMVKERIKRIVAYVCASYEGEGHVEIEEGYEALINDPEVVDIIQHTAEEYLGKEAFLWKEKPSLGVEDMSYFIKESKGAYYHLGCGNMEKNIIAPLHNEGFDIDEDCLSIGVMMQAAIALELLNR